MAHAARAEGALRAADEELKVLPRRALHMNCDDSTCARYMTVKWSEPAVAVPGVQATLHRDHKAGRCRLPIGAKGSITAAGADDGTVEVKFNSGTVAKFTGRDIKERVIVLGGTNSWCSWDDKSSGFFEAHYVVPSYARNVVCTFKVKGGYTVDEWDFVRKDYVRDAHGKTRAAVFKIPDDVPMEARFHLAGSSCDCAVVRAWNAAHPKGQPRQLWEFWPAEMAKPTAPPPVMLDTFHSLGEKCGLPRVSRATVKEKDVLETSDVPEILDKGQTWQDFGELLPPRVLHMTCLDYSCARYMTVKWSEPPVALPGVQATLHRDHIAGERDLPIGTTGIVTAVRPDGASIEVTFKPETVVQFTAADIREGLIAFGGTNSWCSWEDVLSGMFEAHFLVPNFARNVTCTFKVWGGYDIAEWDPVRKDYVRDDDGRTHTAIFNIPDHMAVDAHFHLKGSSADCAVVRAWNVAHETEELRRPWEYWPADSPKPAALPSPTLDAWNLAGESSDRLTVAMRATLGVLEDVLIAMKGERKWQDQGNVGYLGLSTVSTGLSIASASTIVIWPVSLGLGLGASVVGVIEGTAEAVDDGYARVRAQIAHIVGFREIQTLAMVESWILRGVVPLQQQQGFVRRLWDVYNTAGYPFKTVTKDVAYDIFCSPIQAAGAQVQEARAATTAARSVKAVPLAFAIGGAFISFGFWVNRLLRCVGRGSAKDLATRVKQEVEVLERVASDLRRMLAGENSDQGAGQATA